MVDFQYSRIGSKILRREGWHFVPTHAHWCPACKVMHDFAVEQPFRNGARWTFNGNGDLPTFSPSMNIAVGPYDGGKIDRCHYFLRNGRIEFLGDSTHAMAGQTVDLPDVPAEVLARTREVRP